MQTSSPHNQKKKNSETEKKKTASFFQPKLSINTPGDTYEQEADATADRVMRMSLPGTKDTFFTPAISSIQRKCEACEEEEKHVHRKENSTSEINDGNSIDSYVSSLSSSGSPLPENSRNFFEPRFGHDFSNVRIHTDSEAAKSAQSVNALAYTTGNDIVFNQGQYSPGSESGQRLMAHELTHVIQQGSSSDSIQRFESPEHQDIGDRYLGELKDFLATQKGQTWGMQNKLNNQELITGIENDKFYKGGKIKLGNGLLLSPGEVISLMGDFYKTPEDLYNAPAEEVKGILAIIQQEREHKISSGAATIKYNDVTKKRYTDLAQDNASHFSPQNAKEWTTIHDQAVSLAREKPQNNAPLGNEAQLNKAFFLDAAAGHFLTDAFAAGHLLDKDKVLAQIRLYLAANPAKATNPLMQGYIAITSSKTDQFILKIIHDHFNEVGFNVTNGKGMKWQTFGDSHLHNSEETQHIAALAVFKSRQQIVDASKGLPVDDKDILDLLPNADTLERANQEAIAYIPTAATQLDGLIYGNRDASSLAVGKLFGPLVRANLNAIGNPAFDKQMGEQIDFNSQHQLPPPITPQFSFDLPF